MQPPDLRLRCTERQPSLAGGRRRRGRSGADPHPPAPAAAAGEEPRSQDPAGHRRMGGGIDPLQGSHRQPFPNESVRLRLDRIPTSQQV